MIIAKRGCGTARRPLAIASAVCFVLGLGCDDAGGTQPPDAGSDDIFPLAVGDHWVYDETGYDPDAPAATRTIRREVVDFVAMDFENDTAGTVSVFVVDETFPSGGGDPRRAYDLDDGTVVARKRLEILESGTGAAKQTVDYEPALLQIDRSRTSAGDNWDDDFEELTVSVPAQEDDGEWTLEYLYEILEPATVTVPAGTFDCAVVQRTCQSGYPGVDEASPEVTVLYLAPGVGKVKEVTDTGTGAIITAELVEYEIVAPGGGV
jgi:hypothetical protein